MYAILPLKEQSSAKGRLAADLSQEDRALLVQAMAEDVLTALSNSDEISGIFVVTRDKGFSELARRYGARTIEDQNQGLNKAVAHAVDLIRKEAKGHCLILHGDIPLVTSDDVSSLVQSYHQKKETPSTIGILPCKEGLGTNALILDSALEFDFFYGKNSAALHKEEAKNRGYGYVTFQNDHLAMDIDLPEDYRTLLNCLSGVSLSKTALALSTPPANSNRPSDEEIYRRSENWSLEELMAEAAKLRDKGHGQVVSYSRKVFLPLTHLCRNVCHYCTFAVSPSKAPFIYMSVEQAVKTAKEGAALGCKEALFTLGEKPELRYKAAREALADMGFETTLEYVAHVAEAVFKETGLLPHINAGCMTDEEIIKLRSVSASMGLMLENISERLCEKGEAHYGSPDKAPGVRIDTIERAGKLKVPFTTGILIGIGETRKERIDSLLAIRRLHFRYGHIQEIIVQNFVPKENTKMAQVDAATTDDLLWTIAMARLIFGPKMSIQAPPNLTYGDVTPLVHAGINDWGGVSPLTPDYVNPESPWPQIDALSRQTNAAGKVLQERLTIYPAYARTASDWTTPEFTTAILKNMDTEGFAREDEWLTGQCDEAPTSLKELAEMDDAGANCDPDIRVTLDALLSDKSEHVSAHAITKLFTARGASFAAVCKAADTLRERESGDGISYAINRNINYTNMCTYKCQFCAFSKGKRIEGTNEKPYNLDLEEITQRSVEAWHRGASEVCLQGGIHPNFDGHTYLNIARNIRDALPDMHIHAFSPLEVSHGATSLGLSIKDYLKKLKDAGLNSLPGTAAEILADDVRATLCADKVTTKEWLEVMEAAHGVGIRTTATIMFGHVEEYKHWTEHLLHIRDLQKKTGGFTEFVPLPFVADEAPIYKRGNARRGPTLREAILMHAVARLVLHPHITNIQTSWVKMGKEGVELCLKAGANDLGGTLMNESITRAAGAKHGQEWTADKIESIIEGLGRTPWQRTTFYTPAKRRARKAV